MLLRISFLGIVATQGEEETLARGERGARIVAFVEAAGALGFSGAVLAAAGGEVVAAVGVGSADLEGKVANTPATLFEIASATKQFTAAAVLCLVQAGKLALDDPLAKHLPGIPEDCREITVRHLLQHTSGIPGTSSAGGGDDLRAVLPTFLRGGPVHPPGTHWEYWNQGYALLSEVIARASRQSYTQYCRKALFAPAAMASTCFTGDRAPRGVTVAVGRSRQGDPRSALEHPYGSYGFQYKGMGGAVTTVWDLWRWDRALRAQTILDQESETELFRPGLNDYALGWFVRTDRSGRRVQSHGGGVRGFACEVRRYPEEDGCLFVLSNRDDAPVVPMAAALEQVLLEESPSCPDPPRPLPPDLAAAVVGLYRDERGGELAVEQDGGATRVQIRWSAPEGPVTRAFLGAGADDQLVLYEWTAATPVKIERGDGGAVQALALSGRRYARVP